MDPWAYASSPPPSTDAGTSTVRESQRVLAAYPLASAAPIHPRARRSRAHTSAVADRTHTVTRALAAPTLPAAPPSFAHAPAHEYARERAHLAAPAGDGGYWASARDASLRLLDAGPAA
jgi:hypothetical protein